jgi:hypothetical protein
MSLRNVRYAPLRFKQAACVAVHRCALCVLHDPSTLSRWSMLLQGLARSRSLWHSRRLAISYCLRTCFLQSQHAVTPPFHMAQLCLLTFVFRGTHHGLLVGKLQYRRQFATSRLACRAQPRLFRTTFQSYVLSCSRLGALHIQCIDYRPAHSSHWLSSLNACHSSGGRCDRARYSLSLRRGTCGIHAQTTDPWPWVHGSRVSGSAVPSYLSAHI